jgi:copper chaperone NosL
MRKTFILFTALVFALSLTAAALAQDDVKQHPSCKYCGMDREKFAHSRMLIETPTGRWWAPAASIAPLWTSP